MMLKGIIYGVVILIFLIITLISLIAFYKDKKYSLLCFMVSLISSILLMLYTGVKVLEEVKREVVSVIEDTEPIEKYIKDTIAIRTINLTDGEEYLIVELDDLLSGFAHDNEYYEENYLNTIVVIEGKVDTLLNSCGRINDGNCLVLYKLKGSKYDRGFFLYENKFPQSIKALKQGEIVQIKATISSVEFSGMLGVDLVFEDCELVRDENVLE